MTRSSRTPIDGLPLLGGGPGMHVRRPWRWGDPAVWTFGAAAVVWALLMGRQSLCTPVDGETPNTLVRLCYSDIPVYYQSSGLGSGGRMYSQVPLPLPVGSAVLAGIARFVTSWTQPVGPGVSAPQQVTASATFFVVTAVLLGVCFLALVWCHLLLGRESGRRQWVDESGRLVGQRQRSWDALLVAAALPVLTAGLISWELLGVALTSAGLLAWAVRRRVLAGVLLGLAIASGGYPVLVLVALAVLCWRADLLQHWAVTGSAAMGVWMVLNLPVVVVAPQGWEVWWRQMLGRDSDLGSVWYLASLSGYRVAAAPIWSWIMFVVLAGLIAWYVQRVPARPRVGQVAFLLVAAWCVTAQGYSPQYVLWLLPLLVLARPVWQDWAVFSIAEFAYWWAVWGFLNGDIGMAESHGVLYWAATLGRIAALVWVSLRVLADLREPWLDPVRVGHVDDPVGGVLDHVPDPVRAPKSDGEDAGMDLWITADHDEPWLSERAPKDHWLSQRSESKPLDDGGAHG